MEMIFTTKATQALGLGICPFMLQNYGKFGKKKMEKKKRIKKILYSIIELRRALCRMALHYIRITEIKPSLSKQQQASFGLVWPRKNYIQGCESRSVFLDNVTRLKGNCGSFLAGHSEHAQDSTLLYVTV